MEASFCGADTGPNKGYHFTPEMFMQAGRALCLSLLIYCDVNVVKTLNELDKLGNLKKKSYTGLLEVDYNKLNRKNVVQELLGNKKLLNSGGLGGDEEGSDSAPSEDNMEEEDMNKILPDVLDKNSTIKETVEPESIVN